MKTKSIKQHHAVDLVGILSILTEQHIFIAFGDVINLTKLYLKCLFSLTFYEFITC